MTKKWQTTINLKPSLKKIDYSSNILLLGSCFSTEIGQKLENLKFRANHNPSGISFNPISIFQLFNQPDTSNKRIVEKDGLYFHYDFHSSISDEKSESLKTHILYAYRNLHEKLTESNWIILTFGTAIIHETKDGKAVSNCHKQPKENFKKRYLSVQEIIESFSKFYEKTTPNTEILLNVSPVRHTREGISENQLSKSILRVACAQIEAEYANVNYLPTYEVMIDELRDYRFYKEDMIHPSKEAAEYIFSLFLENYFSQTTIKEVKDVSTLLSAINHRPINENSKGHKIFLKELITKLEHSKHNFSKEIASIKRD